MGGRAVRAIACITASEPLMLSPSLMQPPIHSLRAVYSCGGGAAGSVRGGSGSGGSGGGGRGGGWGGAPPARSRARP